ncbi:hypothetical protein [Mycobacteroides abscessus]|uniref:hypothetical protein n=1 Tax=Mycobacteroides abscessus TaxID=36809 RepID=UPI0002E730E8|nr:hypothetical protein [Mycobacteroides abscessus]
MSKGKYKARRQNRDAAQLADDLARVRTQLAREQARLEEARERAAVDAQLRQELAAAIASRDSACATQLNRIHEDRVAIQTATRDLKSTMQKMDAHFARIVRWGFNEFGPERYYALISGDRVFIREGVADSRLDHQAVETIQRARGKRDAPAPDFTTEQRRVLGVEVAAITGIALLDSVTGMEGDGWDEYAKLVDTDPAAQIAFGSPIPWIDNSPMPECLASRVLGADPPGRPLRVDPVSKIAHLAELSTGTAALREATAAAGPIEVAAAFGGVLRQRTTDLAGKSQYSSPTDSGSGYPAPSDAAALHTWYSAAALGAWGRHRTSVNGEVAVAAAAAVPFWLPPGHTMAYLDSEPLSAQDIDDIRLPFAQTLVVFAEPPRIPPLDSSGVTDSDPRLEWMDHLVSANRPIGVRDLIIASTNQFTMPRPVLWDVIGCRGAYVEGILLLADAHGNLEDLFAWCIALPSTTAGAVLGRWVIPASRTATSYANLVVNAAAVAAWADWHRPGHQRDGEGLEAHQESSGNNKAHRSFEKDNVHVLNVTATTPAPEVHGAARGEPTGRTTAPHRRRGHWRRQHYGPGRANTRRVRIAPVMVNAGRVGSDRPQIYRLPAPTP